MPRFRTGHRVPLNVYDGDEPVFQAHDAASAMKLVGLLNMGWRLTQITYDQLQNVFAESERYWGEEDFLDRLRADVWMLLMPKDVVVSAPDRPVERPESPTEGPPATGQPADDGRPRDCGWSGPLFAALESHRCPNAGTVWVMRNVNPTFAEHARLCPGHADLAIDVFGWDLER